MKTNSALKSAGQKQNRLEDQREYKTRRCPAGKNDSKMRVMMQSPVPDKQTGGQIATMSFLPRRCNICGCELKRVGPVLMWCNPGTIEPCTSGHNH